MVTGILKDNGRAQKELYLANSGTTDSFKIDLKINGCTAKALVDTGAMGNFMSQSFVDRMGIPTRKKRLQDVYG